jgi:hypothetical protein
MDYNDYIEDAISQVDAWEVSEENFAQAVNDQARLMAGFDMEPSLNTTSISPYAQLVF